VDVQRDTSPPSAPLPFFPFLMLLSWRVVRISGVVRFLERFGNCEMEWTQESVIEFIEPYKRKEIIWDPKHPIHFNKTRKQGAWEEMGKEMNRPVDECVSANNSSWTEMAFLNALSFFEIFSPIKLTENANSLGDILVKCLYIYMLYEVAASYKDIARAPVAKWERQCVTLAGYAVRDGMKSSARNSVSCQSLVTLRHAITLQVYTYL